MAVSDICAAMALMLSLSISGCAQKSVATFTPAADFYASLSHAGAGVDPIAARDMISILRHNAGLGTLSIDPVLQHEALERAQKMATSGVILRHPSRRLPQNRVMLSDNSAGFDNLVEAFAAWRAAPSTKAHLLNANIRHIGVAAVYAPNSRYKVFWSLLLSD